VGTDRCWPSCPVISTQSIHDCTAHTSIWPSDCLTWSRISIDRHCSSPVGTVSVTLMYWHVTGTTSRGRVTRVLVCSCTGRSAANATSRAASLWAQNPIPEPRTRNTRTRIRSTRTRIRSIRTRTTRSLVRMLNLITRIYIG
jgi:hypothetical protein